MPILCSLSTRDERLQQRHALEPSTVEKLGVADLGRARLQIVGDFVLTVFIKQFDFPIKHIYFVI